MKRHDLPEFIAHLLVGRGVREDGLSSFLTPTFRTDLPSPFSLAGMKACAADVASAVMEGKTFAIFGDFDVDGATSSAVLYSMLKQCGIEAPIYIPERLTEGYGPNEGALCHLKEQGAEILLMLDCGSSAEETLRAGAEMGLKIVVLDHHAVADPLPPAWHLINPKRTDDTSGLDMLAAVGVTFYFCIALNSELRTQGFYNKHDVPEPDLMALSDLVALGTVCDMVPLTSVNRLFVRHGFKQMGRGRNAGLKALAEVAGIEPPYTPYHAGYVLGPRINAGSRVGKSNLGARLFTLGDADAQEARDIAWLLNDCNETRKTLQSGMEEEALAVVEREGIAGKMAICLAQAGWHAGMTGLVAGRVKDHVRKPTCIGCIEGGLIKGSGRSVEGVHIGQAFIDACAQGLALKGGGHAMAGGFTCSEDQFPAFSAFIEDHVVRQIKGELPTVEHKIDSVITVRGAQNKSSIQRLLEEVGPFGAGFEEPLFQLSRVRIHSLDTVGQAHLRLLLADEEGGPRMKAMAFRAVGTKLGEALVKQGRRTIDVVGHLKVNSWQGRETIELHIKDARAASA